MRSLVVVENEARWPFDLPGVTVVAARDYLVDPQYAALRRGTVYNVCRYYGYQRVGYYVSLLATARGHRPLPSVETIQAMRSAAVIRTVSAELDQLIQRTLAPLKLPALELSVYFGRNPAKRYDRLSQSLFNQFPAPFLRATFVRDERWKLQGVRLIATAEIPEVHREFVLSRAEGYFARPARAPRSTRRFRYDLAILWDAAEDDAPSNERAITRFVRAARTEGLDAQVIDADDYSQLAEYDALFIRQTTHVRHHTYRFAQRATADGMVVIDDPESIVRCGNKVYLAELFARHRIPAPRTVVVDEESAHLVRERIGFPCVLKKPDSSFSQGVVKAINDEELEQHLENFFGQSELIVAQSFTPSAFDWRIGVLDGHALFACRYHMATGHWQVVAGGKQRRWGEVETVAVADAPRAVVQLGERAARLFGDGFYGVDLKVVEGKALVMEVNDNPNVDAGYEDKVLGRELYAAVMRWFRTRLDARGTNNVSP
ncbi:MAG TPA: RimK family protein [Gemmatimonadales bacterium]